MIQLIHNFILFNYVYFIQLMILII